MDVSCYSRDRRANNVSPGAALVLEAYRNKVGQDARRNSYVLFVSRGWAAERVAFFFVVGFDLLRPDSFTTNIRLFIVTTLEEWNAWAAWSDRRRFWRKNYPGRIDAVEGQAFFLLATV